MSNRVFGDANFVEATRQFVCVRPDTYESKDNQAKIRILLGGRMENTAFCLLSPDGQERLSGTGRGVTRDVGGAQGLDRVALQYRSKGNSKDAYVPDFNSVRMAMNIASADSRVLVMIVAPDEKIGEVEKKMRTVAWDDQIIGRFHFDLETDSAQLAKPLSAEPSKVASGVYVIRPGEFGVNGTVMSRLELDTPNDQIITQLVKANAEYAKTTPRKTYQAHVNKGHREGYYFEMQMPFGEDRDGDGSIDGSSARRYEGAKSRAQQTGNYFQVISTK